MKRGGIIVGANVLACSRWNPVAELLIGVAWVIGLYVKLEAVKGEHR